MGVIFVLLAAFLIGIYIKDSAFVKFHIAKGQTIEIRGFGTFSLQHRKRRPARNIHTGAVVPLAERYVPTLKFCDAFRKHVTITEVLPEE